MTKKKKIIIAILAVLLLLAGARYAQKSYQKHQVFSNGDFLSAEEKIYGLSVIWETAKTYYGMWALVPDLDWDAEYQAAIGRVLEADSLYAYYNELSAFTALLRDGHTQLGCLDKDFQTALRTGRGFWVSPISLRYMEDAFCPERRAAQHACQNPARLDGHGDQWASDGRVFRAGIWPLFGLLHARKAGGKAR